MSIENTIRERFNKFNKLILDFKNFDIEIDDKDQVLLCSLPNMQDHFKKTLLHGRENLSPF